MREQSSATITSRISLAPALRRVFGALLAAWRDGVYANELLLRRPWEQEGPLRWRRDALGWTLSGSVAELPSPPRALTPAADDDGAGLSRRRG